MRLIVDWDSSIVDTPKAVLELYREDTGDFSTDMSMLEWDLEKMCPKWTRKQIKECFNDLRLFDLLQPYPNAIEVLKYLVDKGHEIQICTCHDEIVADFKEQWIRSNLPFIHDVQVLKIGYDDKLDKSSTWGHIMLDDRIDCLLSTQCKLKVCFGDYEWNKNWNGVHVYNWIQFKNLIDDIDNMLEMGVTKN